MIVHHSYKGNEHGTPMAVPSGPSYNYRVGEIITLLNRTHSSGRPVAGIRIHFRANNSDSTGPNELVAIGVTKGSVANPSIEITTGGQDYILSDNGGTEHINQFIATFNEAIRAKRSLLSTNPTFDANRHACIYFSKDDINAIIDTGNDNLDHLRFHLCDFSVSADGNTAFKSLIISGRDANGGQLGSAIRSDLPCPPHCGTDYPIEVDD